MPAKITGSAVTSWCTTRQLTPDGPGAGSPEAACLVAASVILLITVIAGELGGSGGKGAFFIGSDGGCWPMMMAISLDSRLGMTIRDSCMAERSALVASLVVLYFLMTMVTRRARSLLSASEEMDGSRGSRSPTRGAAGMGIAWRAGGFGGKGKFGRAVPWAGGAALPLAGAAAPAACAGALASASAAAASAPASAGLGEGAAVSLSFHLTSSYFCLLACSVASSRARSAYVDASSMSRSMACWFARFLSMSSSTLLAEPNLVARTVSMAARAVCQATVRAWMTSGDSEP